MRKTVIFLTIIIISSCQKNSTDSSSVNHTSVIDTLFTNWGVFLGEMPQDTFMLSFDGTLIVDLYTSQVINISSYKELKLAYTVTSDSVGMISMTFYIEVDTLGRIFVDSQSIESYETKHVEHVCPEEKLRDGRLGILFLKESAVGYSTNLTLSDLLVTAKRE